MGLFSTKKNPCPVCGAATPRLLATKIVDDQPICSSCSSKISMINTRIPALTAEELKEHLAMREQNAKYLENTFRPNKEISVGWTQLNIDEQNKTFTIPLQLCGDVYNPPVFNFEDLLGYDIVDNYGLIEQYNKGDEAPQLTEAAQNPLRDITIGEKLASKNISRDFKLNLYLSNPNWDKLESSAGSVSGSRYGIVGKYREHLDELGTVTAALVAIIDSSNE